MNVNLKYQVLESNSVYFYQMCEKFSFDFDTKEISHPEHGEIQYVVAQKS